MGQSINKESPVPKHKKERPVAADTTPKANLQPPEERGQPQTGRPGTEITSRSIIRAPDVEDPRDSEGYRIRKDHTGKWRRVEDADFEFD